MRRRRRSSQEAASTARDLRDETRLKEGGLEAADDKGQHVWTHRPADEEQDFTATV